MHRVKYLHGQQNIDVTLTFSRVHSLALRSNSLSEMERELIIAEINAPAIKSYSGKEKRKLPTLAAELSLPSCKSIDFVAASTLTLIYSCFQPIHLSDV